VFISAACISYYGPFTGVFRNKLTNKWLEKCKEDKIESSETFELENVMGDPMKIMDWQIDKLPSDSVSICNAIMIEKGLRKPLLIDPQLQGTTWLKNVSNREFEMQIVRMSDPNIQRTLENSIKMGYEIMIEDMPETIDPLFEPIVNNEIISNGGRKQIKIGDKMLDYDSNFKIYFVTSLANPHFLPEIFIRVTIINFTVTEMGLSQQLLAEIVKIENAAVEAKKNELTLTIANDQKRIKKLEDDILKSLANSSENILDDEDLVMNLDQSKITSDEISKNLEDNKEAQVEIELARSQYKVVADRGCHLFFIIASLAGIDPMYQYSLNYFIKLFKQIIVNSEPSEDVEKRVKILISTITELVYTNICRGLFNTHKLIFSFLIAFQICKNMGEITDQEWNMILKGVVVDKVEKKYKNPDPELIDEKQWTFILNLELLHENFTELPQHFERNLAQWKQWIQTTSSPTKLPFPGGLDDRITLFQRLLIFKALKPERLSFLCREFVEKKLGKEFAIVKPTSMDDVYEDSDNKTPLTFILTQGADPTSSIMNLTKSVKGEKWQEQIHIISLGQGQDKVALKKIAESLKDGCWVLLQNCHLYISFMAELENQVLQISESSHNEDFRLFLTSMPCGDFPISVLQNSIKVTSEPPKGIKANLLGSVNSLKDKFFDSCKKSEELKKFAFSICCFHAIVHERKKFGPLGWNIIYGFNESDFEASQTIIRDMLNDEKEDIAWDAIKYLTGEIIYGGRVTDNQDRRCLMSILETFINPAILEDGYSYTSSGIYKLPQVGSKVQDMLEYVQSLPEVDSPEIFGMNDNADIACLANESNYLLNTVLSIQSKSSMGSSSSQDNDKYVDTIAEKIKAELPELLTREGASKELFKVNKQGLHASLTTYLMQEMERFNKLIVVMDKSLEELRAAIKGLAVMSEELDQMYNNILINKVPEKWAENAYPSLKPLSSWVENLGQRVEFVRSWLVQGRIFKFWMPCFFFPQGFLTAILQEHARKAKIPIDELSFSFKLVESEEDEIPKDKASTEYIIYGLFLESGKINKDTFMLEDAEFGKNFTEPPSIKIIPTRNYVSDPLDYSCPLYKTSERAGTLNTTGHSTNFILMIELPSSYPPDHWIKRGTAMLCQLDD
jgi:dynein heavy chain